MEKYYSLIAILISLFGFIGTIIIFTFKTGKEKQKFDDTITQFNDYKKKNDDFLKILNDRIDDMKRIDEVDGKVEDVKARFLSHENNQNKRDTEMFQTLREISSAVGRLEGRNCN